MVVQALIVATLVGCCFAYAVWTLLPAAARRPLASSLLRLPLPHRLVENLRQAAQNSTPCNCAGCEHAPSKAPSLVQPLLFHPPKGSSVHRP